MFVFGSLLVAMMGTTVADAMAELQFRATSPVLLYVDGRPAAMMGNLKMRARELAPGPHEIRVTGLFGKVLYQGEIDLPDGMITHTEWSDRQVKVIRAEKMREPDPPKQGPWEEPTDERLDDEPVATELIEEELADEIPSPAEQPAPMMPIAPPPLATAQIDEVLEPVEDIEHPVVERLPVPEPAPSHAMALPVGGAGLPAPMPMSVVAQEGTVLEVSHDGVVVNLTVRDGAFVIEDGSGVTVTFGVPRSQRGEDAMVMQEPALTDTEPL